MYIINTAFIYYCKKYVFVWLKIICFYFAIPCPLNTWKIKGYMSK